ncbi:4'-phosphopantetheinyl transferase family protein [Candidatus Thiosymbion oneisti]|uniref:4'-phosphopantetheinyl transferase family protein n=1 Tax=Candidatus Thiosymbion oneisti TaxID=589554 RepID=UPI001FB6C561|nr:4'-phosphopantetheinyl transferase superfamily protein [Candidatus Thiosymbion oneisti]
MEAVPPVDYWHSAAHPPGLSPGGLHLWKICTGCEGAPLAQLWPLLSQRESERVAKLRFDRHRARYVRAQAGLRMILSGYLGVEPEAIGFQYGKAGKPLLEDTASGLEFNLTNSGDLALVALSVGAPVGVDCEQIRDRGDMVAIAERMFTPEQAARIAAATPEDRLQQFHIAWTALEAQVKADGRGLLDRHQPAAQDALQIEHCVPEPGFIAAVARGRLPPVGEWVTMTLSAD